MIGALIVLGIVALAALIVLDRERERADKREQVLLERIQRPERIPMSAAPVAPQIREMDPQRAQAYAAVGTVAPLNGETDG